MRITIIGANSYIARNVIHVLEKAGHELFLYDCQDNHQDAMENYQQVNLLDTRDLNKVNLKSDYIYMFVGKTGSLQGFDMPDLFVDINERTLLHVLNEYVKQEGKGKIIFPSTRLVYKGKRGKLPENSEKEFKTLYAANKYSCEQYLKMYANAYGVKYTIFRICVPYGTLVSGATSYGTAEFFLGRAGKGENITLYGEGQQRRTLTYIGDLCTALIEGAMTEKTDNDIFNIGGEDYSLMEMATMVANKYEVCVECVEWPEKALLVESGDTVFDSRKLDSLIQPYQKVKFENWLEQV